MAKQKVLENGQTEVKLTCGNCKKVTSITANNPEIYTEEIRNNYVCLHCKSGSKLKLKSTIVSKKQVEKPTVQPIYTSTAIKKDTVSTVVKTAESILKESDKITILSEEHQTIIADTVIEIMENIEKLGNYTNLKKAISAAITAELTKKLPKETLKEAELLSKTLYFVK